MTDDIRSANRRVERLRIGNGTLHESEQQAKRTLKPNPKYADDYEIGEPSGYKKNDRPAKETLQIDAAQPTEMGNGQQSKSYASKGKAVKVAKNIPPAAPSTAPAAPSTAPAAPSTANGVQKELLKDLAAPKGRRFNFRNKNMGNN